MKAFLLWLQCNRTEPRKRDGQERSTLACRAGMHAYDYSYVHISLKTPYHETLGIVWIVKFVL